MNRRRINLATLVSLKNTDTDLLEEYKKNCNIQIKDHEVDTYAHFIKFLNEIDIFQNVKTYGLFLDYKLPGFAKEFDVIKISDNFLLNIEFKLKDKTISEMQEQLIQNKYYLEKTKYEQIYLFSYKSDTNTLYKLDDNGNMVDVSTEHEIIDLLNSKDDNNSTVDDLLSPSDYLISPFNNTEKFINGEYLLNQSQQSIKSNLLEKLKSEKIVILFGRPGTGKSLVLYDIIKDYLKNNITFDVLHCAKLNVGHYELNKHGFNITPLKDIKNIFSSTNNMLFVDEVQRLKSTQIEKIIAEYNGKIIFSGDPEQTLGGSEVGVKLKEIAETKKIYNTQLKTKMRSNESLAEFILGLMNKNHKIDPNHKIDKDSISLDFFTNDEEAKNYMMQLTQDNNFKVLVLPGSLYKNDLYTQYNYFSNNAFDVIGQEFDNVATLVGNNIKYKEENGRLYSDASYYISSKSLFQNLTRSRKKIKLIIVNNIEVFKRALELTNNETQG